MHTALYYPHATMSAGLVKNAFFLWDRVEYIAPWEDFDPNYDDKELGDAVKLISDEHVPSPESQRDANDAIIDILKLPLPDWFYVKNIPKTQRFRLYPKKFGPETWDLLEGSSLAEEIGDGYETSAPLGLTILSLLADSCAGKRRRLVTDEQASYSALDRYLVTIGGGELGEFDDESEKLVTISLRIMNLKDVSLSRLVELRQKENTGSGSHLRIWRQNYLAKIEQYADDLANAEARDAEDIEHHFEEEMNNDFDLLKDELKDEAKKVFFSKEMATAAIAIAGSFIEPTTGLAIAGGALYKKKVEYRAARNKTLDKHPMSWLYATKRVTPF